MYIYSNVTHYGSVYILQTVKKEINLSDNGKNKTDTFLTSNFFFFFGVNAIMLLSTSYIKYHP